MNFQDYKTAQAAVQVDLGLTKTASTLLTEWTAFVSECEEGYPWDVSEYNHELSVRDRLASLLEAPGLQSYSEHHDLGGLMALVDGRFRALLLPEVSLLGEESWWRAGVLRYAGEEYAQYFRDAHAVVVEVRKR